MRYRLIFLSFLFVSVACSQTGKKLTQFVNPFLGTAPLQDSIDCGYNPPRDWRVWAGLTYPGASLPNAMVQLSPITEWRSGAGYEYEDDVIYSISHIPTKATGTCAIYRYFPLLKILLIMILDQNSVMKTNRHEPGYYQVKLDRYGINVQSLQAPYIVATINTTFENKGNHKRLL